MRRILPFLLVLSLLAAPALADPLVLLDDYAEDISELYDDADPSAGRFVYSCRYPHVDENAEGSMGINTFYSEQLEYERGFTMPIIRDAFEGYDSSTVISYTVTCNNDDYFSVLRDGCAVDYYDIVVIDPGVDHTFAPDPEREKLSAAL